MKRYIILSYLMAFFTLTALAQSTMTDEQIMQFVVKEHAAGTSNQQIVTQLMQRGVDIQQIRRVRNKYEREVNSK
jgi:type IV pilus biogenesis protein CpaD/CtpE